MTGIYVAPGSDREPGQQNPEANFGPKVIGEDKAAFYAKQRHLGASIFGPRITGEPVENVAPVVVVPAKPTPTGAMSVQALTGYLEEFPDRLDIMLQAETQRVEGVRKGALRVLQAAELRREAGARPDVVTRIVTLLGGSA